MRPAPRIIFLLLLSEVLVVPASLMLLYLPVRTTVVALRSLRLLFRINRFMRRMLVARKLFRLTMLDQRQNKVVSLLGLARDSCLHRFLCEMRMQRRQRNESVDTSEPEQRLAITISLSQPMNVCGKKFRACPYNAEDMMQAFAKLREVWPEVKLPSHIDTNRDTEV